MSRTSIVLLALAACGTSQERFLDAKLYDRMEPGEKPGTLVWMKEGCDLRQYHYLLIDPIACVQGAGSEALSPEQKQKAKDAFHGILVEKVDPYYPVVKEPGPHVLRVRIALTELTPSKGDMGVGAAALEVDLRDAQTGDVLCAAVSRIEGSMRAEGADEEWKAVEGAFHEWAERLLDFMDSHHQE